MDAFDNPRMVKRPTEDSVEPANETETRAAQESAKQSSGSEPPVTDANPEPIDNARREKIESLKKAVADGTYTVSAEEVARKLIEHMLEPKE
jgi:anti-sigma28 factor (negative regulator of flagellin synthesis)